jgi:hypothetical protein
MPSLMFCCLFHNNQGIAMTPKPLWRAAGVFKLSAFSNSARLTAQFD